MRSTAQIFDLRQYSTLSSVSSKSRRLNRLVIANSDGSHIIPYTDIRRCVSDGNYCKVFLTNGRELVASKTLKHVESRLPGDQFLRVHQSHLVNRDDVRFIGADYLKMSDDSKIPISRGRKSYVAAQFKS